MNGIHDLGGMHGLGPIDIDPEQAIFDEDWQRRMFGMFILTFAGGHFNLDQFRSAIEQMSPTHYLTSDYYEHWLYSMETWCKANGTLTEEEITQKISELKQQEAA